MARNDLEEIHRLRSHDVELGLSDVLNKHVARHAAHQKPVSQRRLDFEHRRPLLLREMFAEATGVFFYGKVATSLHRSSSHHYQSTQASRQLPSSFSHITPNRSWATSLPLALLMASGLHSP
jgi:hypothetical protein